MIERKKRGGRREGAGRPRLLNNLQELEIGLECQRRLDDARALKRNDSIAAYLNRSDYVDLSSQAKAVPPEDRRLWLLSHEGCDHTDDVDSSLREMQRTPDDVEPSRTVHIAVKRTYGLRSEIVSAVALWASSRLGIAISERHVRSCWKHVSSALQD